MKCNEFTDGNYQGVEENGSSIRCCLNKRFSLSLILPHLLSIFLYLVTQLSYSISSIDL